MLIDCWWQQKLREMIHSPPHKCFHIDFYWCISICWPTHLPSMGDIIWFFQIFSLVVLMTSADSLHGHSPTSYVCIRALPNSSCPQLCFFLSYSIIPLEILFLKFLSRTFKRMIVKFSVKKRACMRNRLGWLSMNNKKYSLIIRNNQLLLFCHLPFFDDRASW